MILNIKNRLQLQVLQIGYENIHVQDENLLSHKIWEDKLLHTAYITNEPKYLLLKNIGNISLILSHKINLIYSRQNSSSYTDIMYNVSKRKKPFLVIMLFIKK